MLYTDLAVQVFIFSGGRGMTVLTFGVAGVTLSDGLAMLKQRRDFLQQYFLPCTVGVVGAAGD